MRKESRSSKVVQFKDSCARLRRASLKLGGMDLDKSLAIKVGAEKVTNARLNTEYGLSWASPEVDDPVIQANSLGQRAVLSVNVYTAWYLLDAIHFQKIDELTPAC